MPEKTNKATVHLVSFDTNGYINTEKDRDDCRARYSTLNKYDDDPICSWFLKNHISDATEYGGTLHISDINEKYPGLVSMMKRGDLVENINESGYRSNGIYCYDGEDIVYQNRTCDDYGMPSSSFKIVHEFPPGYWDNPEINNKFEPDHNSTFYWHYGYACNRINFTDFDDYVIDETNDTITFTHNKKKYIIICYGERYGHAALYVRHMSTDEVRQCNKTSKKLGGVKNGMYHYVLICDC